MRLILFSGCFTMIVLLCMVLFLSLTERINVYITKLFKNDSCGAYVFYIGPQGEYIQTIMSLDCSTMELLQKNEDEMIIACKNGVYLSECSIRNTYILLFILALYVLFGLYLITRRMYISNEYQLPIFRDTYNSSINLEPIYHIPCREIVVNSTTILIGTPDSPNRNDIIVCENP